MTYWTTQHFKALQKAWYDKLKAQGFDDAEVLVKDELYLKQPSNAEFTRQMQRLDELTRQSREDYYRVVSQLVQQTAFKSSIDAIIMTCHASGMRIVRIREEIAKTGHSRTRHAIRFRIRVFEMKWGLRSYTPQKLNRKAS